MTIQIIDYYNSEYWKKNRDYRKITREREKIAIKIINKIVKKNSKVLDTGCGEGNFMRRLIKISPNADVRGIELSKDAVKEAKKSRLNVTEGDLNNKIKFEKNFFDIIYCGEVIEHLYNPDAFLEEVHRVLNKEGYLIVTTPNLAAWFNRILFLIGVQPVFLETSTKNALVGAGFIKKLRKLREPIGHIRVFTLSALKDILDMNGFEILEVRGVIFEDGFPKFILPVDRLFSFFPSLSSQLVILAKKKES